MAEAKNKECKMALSANTPVAEFTGRTEGSPVYTLVNCYEGGMLGDISGYVRPLTAGDRFRGHALEQRNNTSGSSGDLNIQHLAGIYRLQVTLASVAITDVGRDVYASDDATLTLVANGMSWVGKVVRYVTTNTAVVEFNTQATVSRGRLMYAQTTAGTALTNSTVETILATTTLKGARFRKGDVIRVRAQGIATATNSTDTLNLKLYIGTEMIAQTGAVDVANSDIWLIDADIVIRTIGASGTMVAAGTTGLGAVGTVTAKPFLLAEATEDISGDVACKITGTWSVANSGNSCRNDLFNVQILDAAAA
jgi:hypothetical protein